MSGLLGLLDLGAGALLADNAGVAVAGRNATNVNTEGYSRESIDLEAELAAPLVGGVSAGDPTRAADALLAARERLAQGASGKSGAQSAALGGLESDLTTSTNDLGQQLGVFFGSLNALAASPLDSARRQAAVTAAQSVASSFNAGAQAIARAQSDSDGRVAALATQATQLASQIAGYNRAIATSADPVLADKRDLAARQLATIVGGQARVDPDGQMRFVVAGGAVLVDGTHASQVTATPDATLGNHLRIDVVDGVHDANVTGSLDGGSLAGEISFRDGTAATAAAQLDQLASDFASQVNTVHSANAALDGTTGRALFTTTATATGAAAALQVSSAIAGDPDLLAAAAAGAGPSDASGATALAALGEQSLAAGNTRTFSDEAIATVADVGAAAKAASDTDTLNTARSDALAQSRDSISGVSADEELANLQKFQHAAEAATQFVSTVNSLLDNLIQNL